MALIESKSLELKEKVTSSFLKTVSAYANYGDGRILFGVSDEGNAVGLKDVDDSCLRIEHMIHDSITPQPHYSLEVDPKQKIVTLLVKEGAEKPYLCSGKAYIRADTSTSEVDALELRRLVLIGKRMPFDQLPSEEQNLAFNSLKVHLRTHLGVDRFDHNTLRTLGLVNSDGKFVNAASLLSDTNPFPGIDLVRYGNNTRQILARRKIETKSVLEFIDESVSEIEKNYSYEEVTSTTRNRTEQIPLNAFREAIANAIAHRTWDVPAAITVAMHPDHIVVTSPGGLVPGIGKETYLEGGLSIPRNPTLANVLYRLGYVELFGSGVPLIRTAYKESSVSPSFDILDASIRITLPTLDTTKAMTLEERTVLDAIPKNMLLTRTQIQAATGMSQAKTIRVLRSLVEQGFVQRTGTGRGTRYALPN